MKKSIILPILLLCVHIFTFGQQAPEIRTTTLLFETNKHELKPDQQQQLTDLLHSLTGKPADYDITVTGHTDARGSDAFNQALSLRRGNSVSDFLTTRGFAAERISLVADGEKKPTADNASDDGMTRNRRVEVRFEHRISLAMPSDLVPKMKIHFPAERGIKFESPRSGSKVDIPAGALVYADGRPVTGEVELNFREWRNFYEYLSFGQTMHYHDSRGGFFFNSNGMFEVGATQNGQELSIGQGKSIEVTFMQMQPDMQGVNLYQYDPKTGEWMADQSKSSVISPLTTAPGKKSDPTNYGTAALGNIPGQPVFVADQFAAASNAGLGKPKCIGNPLRFPNEVRPAQLLAQSVQTGLDLATGKELFPIMFIENPALDDSAIVRRSERSSIMLELLEDNQTYFFLSDRQNYFKELDILKEYRFEYLPSVVKDDNFSQDKLQTNWESVYFAYSNDVTNIWEVTLATPTKKTTIQARLRYSDGRPVDIEVAEKAYIAYKKIQNERWSSMLTDIEHLRRFLALSVVLREGDELCMDQTGWLRYFIDHKKAMADRYAKNVAADYANNTDVAMALIDAYNKRCRSERLAALEAAASSTNSRFVNRGGGLGAVLQIFSFGIYNCDQIYRLGRGTEVITATFKTRDGQPVRALQTDVVEKSTQMMLSAPQPNQVYYSPNKTFDIIVRGENGRVFLLKEVDFAKMQLAGRSQADFVLDEITEQIKTPRDWMKVLGI